MANMCIKIVWHIGGEYWADEIPESVFCKDTSYLVHDMYQVDKKGTRQDKTTYKIPCKVEVYEYSATLEYKPRPKIDCYLRGTATLRFKDKNRDKIESVDWYGDAEKSTGNDNDYPNAKWVKCSPAK